MLPVRINDAVAIPFVLDSGAAEVSIPLDVFLTLRRTGTVGQSDFIGTGTYTLADGSTTSSERYVLHKMAVGSHVITNVVANVAPVQGDPLLGESFLVRLPAWSIDNARHALVLNDRAGATVAPGDAADSIVYTYANGGRYVGEWLDGRPNGHGLMIYPNGQRFEGEWRDGEANGHGIGTYSTGRYDGEFRNNRFNGHGVYSYTDGSRYDGEWRDDKRSGHGLIIYPNGQRYDGEWRDDKPYRP